MRKEIAGLILLASNAWVVSASAALQIKDVRVYPNPVRFSGTVPPRLNFDITVGTFNGLPDPDGCVLDVDFGDGTQAPRYNFPPAGNRRASYTHVYEKPGTYSFVAGGWGDKGCSGQRRISVTVEEASGGVPRTSSDTPATCPAGWTPVEGSQKGSRFSCHANPPPQPIACTGGTKYFEAQGLIGCR